MSSSKTIFVTGATGAQGGSTARQLLRNNWAVHALVRDPTSAASLALKSQGASIFKGDWDDLPALHAAAAGCHGLFLNSYPDRKDPGAELRRARNVLTAAKAAGIKHVVHVSATHVDRYFKERDFDRESFMGNYFYSKATIEEEVRNGGYETWTILRGVMFMSNLLLPSAAWMWPELATEGRFVSAFHPDTLIPLIYPEDIGRFAFAAFSDPQRFGGKGIEVAVEVLTVQQIANLMEKVSGKRIKVEYRSKEDVEAQKGKNPLIDSQILERIPVDIEEVKAWGIPLTSFEEYLEKEKDLLFKSIGDLA